MTGSRPFRARSSSGIVRLGGWGAVLAGAVFLVTILYTFGYLFALGLTTEMLNRPAELLPWIHAHTMAYAGLWWIFALHLILLLPAPLALAEIVGRDRSRVRTATVAGLAGAVVGMVAAMVLAAWAPVLGAAAATASPASLPGVLVLSEMAGALALHLRLLSDLLVALWLVTTGVVLSRHRTPWRQLGYGQIGAGALTLVVVAGKPFDLLDLEPLLGFLLALVYLWMGAVLLRVGPNVVRDARDR